jgi:Na+/H+ antiporter NhaA
LSSKIERKVEAVISPLQAFMRDETVSSGLLFAATVAALLAANSPWAGHYYALWQAPLIAILLASSMAGLSGYLWLRRAVQMRTP